MYGGCLLCPLYPLLYTPIFRKWKRKVPRVLISTIDLTQKDSLLEYVLNFLGILAGWCGSVVVRDRD